MNKARRPSNHQVQEEVCCEKGFAWIKQKEKEIKRKKGMERKEEITP